MSGGMTRRDFLRGTAVGATTAALAGTGLAAAPEAAAHVVLVRDAAVLDNEGRLDAGVLARMLDDGVKALAGTATAAAGWKAFFKPGDTVGVKTNHWDYLPTPPPLEDAIRRRLLDVPVHPAKIAIDDRGARRNEVFRNATALINVRPMRTHHWAGVGSLIKNYINFDEEPSRWHPDACADLAGVWKLPQVAGRTRLNVLVMLKPLFHSTGPHDFNLKYTWAYKGLLLGTDPVAVDATGLRILEARRREFFGQDQPFEVPPKHIRLAAEKHRLGVADPAKIKLTKIGWAEGGLLV